MKSLYWLFCCSLLLGHANGVTVNESTLPDSGFADLETSKHIKIVPLNPLLRLLRLFLFSFASLCLAAKKRKSRKIFRKHDNETDQTGIC
ncbi:MAG: hypothetical protein PHO37_16580 [Kiritimatiellae bacterium]|nr:hypothetical protein [Kiritimatiellia bacterium]